MDGPSSAPDRLPTRPYLRPLPYSHTHRFQVPRKCINSHEHMDLFGRSTALADITTFLLQLNVAMFPRMPGPGSKDGQAQDWPLHSAGVSIPSSISRLAELVHQLDELVDQVAPKTGPRRFGNVAFREWHRRAAELVPRLVLDYITATPANRWLVNDAVEPEPVTETAAVVAESAVVNAIVGEVPSKAEPVVKVGATTSGIAPVVAELSGYLVGALGSGQRLDYGTGHELSFIAFLACLHRLGCFGDASSKDGLLPDHEHDNASDDSAKQNTERALVIAVIEPYLTLIRKIILKYSLEPAGSHGVWGLDDHSFVPYILGSAQLCSPISSILDITTRGSLPSAPNPQSVSDRAMISRLRTENMYFSALGFIYDVKTGNFWEHSPLLSDISRLTGGWNRINNGMIAMFADHVLSKFPVVQHFPFGSLLRWERDSRPVRRPIARVVRDPDEPVAPMPAVSVGRPILSSSIPGLAPGSIPTTTGGVGVGTVRPPPFGAGGRNPTGSTGTAGASGVYSRMPMPGRR